jgi:hypothetical protein
MGLKYILANAKKRALYFNLIIEIREECQVFFAFEKYFVMVSLFIPS